MIRLVRILGCLLVLAALFASAGCGGKPAPDPSAQGPAPATTEAPAAAANAAPAAPAPPSKTKQIMTRIGSGPTSLNSLLDRELKGDKPEWDAIQSQTVEFAKLAKELGTAEPPRGSKESWSKQTSGFADKAVAAEKAAAAKDLASARVAQKGLVDSCTACHTEHRIMRARSGGSRMGGY